MKNQRQSEFKRFDMRRSPGRQRLLPIIWALSFPAVWKHRVRYTKIGMEGIRPPYLLLCNHNAFFDFKVASAALFPHRANYVVAIDGFIGREWLLRLVGCICKRKFTSSTVLIRHLQKVVENGDVAVLYPEARYSLCGTASELPESIGKLAKLLGVPVVTLITRGNHVNSPFWNLGDRSVRTEAEVTCIIHADEIRTLSVDEINRRINEKFNYDDFAWQKMNKVSITEKDRARGLHKVLYQCPNCGTQYRMDSGGTQLWCGACGKKWEMTALGELEALCGQTEFSHIPDWYEWQRSEVRREVEEGTYRFEAVVQVYSLPNAKGYIHLGRGRLTHGMEGFVVEGEYLGEYYRIEKPVSSQYACHIEYDYRGKYGDCVDLNTLNDTYYIYPQETEFSVTKIALATEELYKFQMGRRKVGDSALSGANQEKEA